MDVQSCDISIYALIGNIPSDYHSSDLRNFFSRFIENETFECFHFKHRPEGEKPSESNIQSPTPAEPQGQCSGPKVGETSNTGKLSKPKKKTCCITKLKEAHYRDLVQLYHKRHWIGRNGETIPSMCFISKIKTLQSNDSLQCGYKTRQEMKQNSVGGKELTSHDLDRLQELHPPEMMPNGNVGTPTKVFLELIKECRLPPKIIGKLGLNFPKSRNRCRYGNVKFDYGMNKIRRGSTKTYQMKLCNQEQEPSKIGSSADNCESEHGYRCSKIGGFGKNKHQEKTPGNSSPCPEGELNNKPSDSEDDDDDCEEWERHEALHDDPANYERNKERAYEEDLEVVWEKGGPGLVWYTDEKYWREQKGDFDEQETDDWDVDMSIYYDPDGGDKDARDLLIMRQDKRRRRGFDDDEDIFGGKVGRFEKHTKGIGRKVLEQQGWTEGSGLGSTITGMAEALDNDGQKPSDKTGFGYHGDKLPQYYPSTNSKRARKRRDEEDIIISTKYDYAPDLEIAETSLRRVDHKTMKHRDGIHFKKPEDSQWKPCDHT